METMSEKEREQLLSLQAKQKRVNRQMKEFLSYADEHKEELLERWNMSDTKDNSLSDKMNQIASLYGVDLETLLDYFSSDRQVSYYKNYNR